MTARAGGGLRTPTRTAACLGAVVALSGAALVHAHVGHVILRGERYLKLDATDDDTRLVVSLTLGPDEGRRILEAADGDGDGEVTTAESEAYLAEWAAGLTTEVPVTIDGEPVALTWTDGWLEPTGPVVRTPLTLELVAHLPTPGMEHLVTFHDEMVRREVYDRTDVAFRGHSGAELVVSGVGETPPDVEEDLGLVGDTGPQVFTARVRYPHRTWLGTRPRWQLGLAGGVVAALAIAAGVAQRRGRKAPPA